MELRNKWQTKNFRIEAVQRTLTTSELRHWYDATDFLGIFRPGSRTSATISPRQRIELYQDHD
jgi:hypothetical protein